MAKVFLRSYNREIEKLIDRGQLDEAIAHCHHILKTFPKHLETYRLLGKAYLEGKRYGDAVDLFSRVLDSVPNDFVSHVGLSIIRDEENKLDDAIWHMERAFETQPSNAAIQSELQRLYGRRGVRPPRIRMTRGALAHMYVQGELYPQAISEIKSVLKEDPGRSDMQALLARANFKSGAKNDAVDAALALLQRYPYALDGNRVLVEVLSADRNENAQSYRQRLVELDPYAAQVSNSVFQSNEVADAAVSLEQLDWNGQPVGMASDWRDSQAIGLESGTSRDDQPDWLKASTGTVTPPPLSEPTSGFGFETPSATPAQPADEIPDFMKSAGWGQSSGAFDESKSMFANEEPTAAVEPLAQGDLPDWVKAMKPPEPEPEPAASDETEEALPDWINKIGTGALGATDSQADWMSQPEQTQEPAATSNDDQPDWLKGFGTAQESAQAAQDQPDWLKGFGSESDVAQPAQTDTPDWLTGIGSVSEPDLTPQPAQTDTPDWLKGIEAESETPAAQFEDDWMKQLGSTTESSTLPSEELDFLKELTPEPLEQPAQEIAQPMSNIDDFVKSESEQEDSFAWLEDLGTKQDEGQTLIPNPEELMEPQPEVIEPAQSIASEPPVSQPSAIVDELGKSEQERDDSFAWLEGLAAKQGASEGLLTKPEERMEQEPEWVRQAKGLTGEVPVSQTPVNAEELGKSEQERDDSFAWLESLAAKQGASEGLLTKPEERLEDEPEWVRQAKGLVATSPATPAEAPVTPSISSIEEAVPSEQIQDDTFAWLENLGEQQGESEGLPAIPEESLQEKPEWMEPAASLTTPEPVSQPSASVDELGKSEQERDDSFAWLENLAAKQGATEGLLTKPEERLEQEPEWVRQAKDQGAQQPVTPAPQEEPVMEQPVATDDTAAWLKSLEEEKQPEPASAADQTAIWLKNLAEEEKQPETVPAADETAIWLKNLEQEEKQPETVSSADETAMWLQNLEQSETVAAEPTAEPVDDADMPAWMKDIDREETPAAEPTVAVREAEPISAAIQAEETDVPSWLSDLDKEEKSAVSANALASEDDLPAWLREDTSDVVAEPTRPGDWKSAEPQQPEIQYSPALEETKQPEIIYSPALEEPVQPEPVMAAPVASFEEQPAPPPPPEETPEPAPQAPSRPATPPEPMKEPVTRKGTGMLVMPGIDPMLGTARSELSRSNIPGALESYTRLIKKGRYLDEVIYDLRDALYRYPVEVSIWQSLGDAYMRSNRLQDALDAYTKAEELLR